MLFLDLVGGPDPGGCPCKMAATFFLVAAAAAASACTLDMSWTEGSYPGEVTWEIYQADGTYVCGGYYGDTGCEVDACSAPYLNMYDSWGDGWNGNILTIDGVDYTIDDGGSAVVDLPDCNCGGSSEPTPEPEPDCFNDGIDCEHLETYMWTYTWNYSWYNYYTGTTYDYYYVYGPWMYWCAA